MLKNPYFIYFPPCLCKHVGGCCWGPGDICSLWQLALVVSRSDNCDQASANQRQSMTLIDQWEASNVLSRSQQTIITRGPESSWAWPGVMMSVDVTKHWSVTQTYDSLERTGTESLVTCPQCIYSLNDVLICLISCWYKTNKERPDQMRSRDIVTLMDEARDTRGQTWRRLDKTALFEPHQPGTNLDTNNSRDKVL